ncbi:hypothetical protein C6W88_10800 [Halomonas litopenaei]|uniref:Uncharacterized protein n=1 Tax=Halomonas litopenaei TaxID=2109328 RepID=A0ABX5IW74_9GAMM|nr:hypothetical protein C6W89_06945 [Halomonas sp. SYSU XM8]PTL94834.1 hypothetical protein C6W88_10800 [Halomonas litopenaei]
MVRKRSLQGVNEHFDPIFNAVLPSAGTFQTSLKSAWSRVPATTTRAPGSRNCVSGAHSTAGVRGPQARHLALSPMYLHARTAVVAPAIARLSGEATHDNNILSA